MQTIAQKVNAFYATRARKSLKDIFEITSDEFNQQEKKWNEFITNISRRLDSEYAWELIEKKELHDCFKARVLALLLTPRIRNIDFPFSWSERSTGWISKRGTFDNSSVANRLPLSNLSKSLVDYVVELLSLSIEVEKSQCKNRHFLPSVVAHNDLIIRLLEFLPSTDPRLNTLFELYDFTSHYGCKGEPCEYRHTDARSYGHFIASSVSKNWKVRAIEYTKQQIIAGQNGDQNICPWVHVMYEEYLCKKAQVIDLKGVALDLFMIEVTFLIKEMTFNFASTFKNLKTPLIGLRDLKSLFHAIQDQELQLLLIKRFTTDYIRLECETKITNTDEDEFAQLIVDRYGSVQPVINEFFTSALAQYKKECDRNNRKKAEDSLLESTLQM